MMSCPSPRDGSICGEPCAGDSRHCELHASLLRPLYLKYKAVKINHILEMTEQQLSACNVETLLKYLNRVEQVYHLRINHRRLAFVPALWDRGHNRRIEMCIGAVFKIREVLKSKFSEAILDSNNEDNLEEIPEKTNTAQSASLEAVNIAAKVCTTMIEIESDWGDSEAIENYKRKTAQIKIGKKVVKSMFLKDFDCEDRFVDKVIDQLINSSIIVGSLCGLFHHKLRYKHIGSKYRVKYHNVKITDHDVYQFDTIMATINKIIKYNNSPTYMILMIMEIIRDKHDAIVTNSGNVMCSIEHAPDIGKYLKFRFVGCCNDGYIVDGPDKIASFTCDLDMFERNRKK